MAAYVLTVQIGRLAGEHVLYIQVDRFCGVGLVSV